MGIKFEVREGITWKSLDRKTRFDGEHSKKSCFVFGWLVGRMPVPFHFPTNLFKFHLISVATLGKMERDVKGILRKF